MYLCIYLTKSLKSLKSQEITMISKSRTSVRPLEFYDLKMDVASDVTETEKSNTCEFYKKFCG